MHCLFFHKKHARNVKARPYPEVNATLFKTSAKKAISLMEDANLVMTKITSSTSFSSDLMAAAQQSQQNEVERLIHSTGIKKKPKIKFNPDGLTMNFVDYAGDKECCHIITQLRWE
ncbi:MULTISPECIES: hypothetical protein [unclassified Bacillus (in: firmicutes)]|uniref:hypothetical protein n=1 Tax=unclassified Bacillus (in: firmicutes) TaxID=185979 RepID=UPI001BEA724D|nr:MULTISPECIES: hypothetical protein [unclassified Bacillus (in: firmicutes)]MBT2638115.1 hypothetical protein [Bacillus sp. ISL-39]MBT2659440.1 hypothetical protein [Bacillus sp. ISL-45]